MDFFAADETSKPEWTVATITLFFEERNLAVWDKAASG